MNVLGLFDGMSCGQIALNRAGIKYDKYFACEIDKHAIKVTQANYPHTIQLGDVTKVKSNDLPKIDLLIGGSPCQGFSFAGKQLAFDDPRSVLFFEYVRLLKEYKPKYFLLENVKMKREHELVISKYLGIDPIEINSSLVTAQNRVRLYWTNIASKPFGLFGDVECTIPQPKDKGIVLKDILETEVDEKYYLKNPKLDFSGLDLNGKGNTLRASGHASQTDKHNFDLICVASRGRNPDNPKSRKPGLPTEQMLEPRFDGKTNCLTSVGKDNLILNENTIRRLTPIECERLQTVDKVEKEFILALCLEKAKSLVLVVETNPKLLELVLNVEKIQLHEFVKFVKQNIKGKNQKIKNIAQKNADTKILNQIKKCMNPNQKGKFLIVNHVINCQMCSCQNLEADFVARNVFINLTEGKIMYYGVEESPQKEERFTVRTNGKIALKLSGINIMQLVKDVEKNLNTGKAKNFTSTISSHLYTNNIEQTLAILYFYAKNAIIGHTQSTIKKNYISITLSDGYTAHVSDSQRYRMLGNGWTVDVIAHILRYM
jgi:DNA-cytosine methyltransferase